MSLAQRRTDPEGIDTVPPSIPEDAILSAEDGEANGQVGMDYGTTTTGATTTSTEDRNRRGSAVSSIPAEDGKEIWRALSYDPFPPSGPPGVQHYESFPAEIGTDNVGAFEVSTAKRIAQVAFAVLACTLASGIVCGFAALKPILIAEGVYRSLCPPDWPAPSPGQEESQIPCPAQDMRLNLFFITASIALNVSTVLAGYVLDNHGRRVCYLLSALILFLGSACMSLSFHLGERRLGHFDGYVAGNLLLGLGGTFLFVSSYQLANAFPRRAGLVVALVTGAFDASAAVFLFYRLAYEAASSSSPPGGLLHNLLRPAGFFLLFAAVVPPAIAIAEFALMPAAAYSTRREYQAAIAAAQDDSRDAHDPDGDPSSAAPFPEERRRRRASERGARLEAIETVTGGADDRRAAREAAKGRQAASGVAGAAAGLRRMGVGAQMATPWFWLLLAMTALQMTRMNYFIATVRAQYRYLLGGDEALAGRVNAAFDAALPVAGVVTTPFIGLLLNEVPVWGTMAVLTGFVAVLGVVNCLEGRLWAAYATVGAFVLFRPLYYSAVSDYATKVFGFRTFGRIYGTIICVSGVTQLVQPALDVLVHGPLHDNPIPLNIFFAVAGSLICGSLTVFVYSQTEARGAREDLKEVEAEEEERAALLS